MPLFRRRGPKKVAYDNATSVIDRADWKNDPTLADQVAAQLRAATRDDPGAAGRIDIRNVAAVIDPVTNETRFFLDESYAERYRRGEHVTDQNGHRVDWTAFMIGKPVKWVPEKYRLTKQHRDEGLFGLNNQSPYQIISPNPESKRALDAIFEGLEAGEAWRSGPALQKWLKARGVLLGELSQADKKRLAAALMQQASVRPGRVDMRAIEETFLSGAQREEVRQEGGATRFYNAYLGEVPAEVRREWEARTGQTLATKEEFLRAVAAWKGIPAQAAKRMTQEELLAAQPKRDAAARQRVDKKLNESLETDIQDIWSLAKPGLLGDKSVRRLIEAGITLEDLRSGRVNEDRLKGLGHVGAEKIERLRKYFPIPPSQDAKRGPGRPPKLFGEAMDPFRRRKGGLLTTTQQVRSPSSGQIEHVRVPGKLTQLWGDFKASFRDTVGRPFALVKQVRDSESHRYVREAREIAGTKRALSFRTHEVKARNGLAATFWEALFQSGKAIRLILLLTIGLGSILFLPLGAFQYAGWIVFGFTAFAINGAYLIGLTMLNLVATGVINSINALGFTTQTGLQGFLDQVHQAFPTSNPNDQTLPSYSPIPFDLKITNVIDPNTWFPDCVNTDSLGSVGLHILSEWLTAFSAWVGTNGAFAVGASVILFVGVPAYFVSRGTSLSMTLLGVFIMVTPGLSDGVGLPLWALLLSVLVLGGGCLFAIWRLSMSGPFALALGVGVAVAGLLAVGLVYQGISMMSLTGALDFFKSVNAGVTPIAHALAGTVHELALGLDAVAGLVKTGWAHALDPANFVGVRAALSQAADATSLQAQCAGGA